VPAWVTAAFQELDTDSAVSANANPAVHPVSAVVPVSVTVSWSWYPPDQDVTTEDDRAHDPAAAVVDGEADGDGDGPGPVDVVYGTCVYAAGQPFAQPDGREKLYTSPLFTRFPFASVTWIS
jgi:hypothetical protein